jgi:ABC-2 type transport system ATP-binding protein
VELRELLRELRSLGKTILISSHILPELEELCTSVAIVDRGRVLDAGTIAEIGQRMRVGEVLRVRVLGGEAEAEAARAWFEGRSDVASATRDGSGEIEIGFRGNEVGAAALLAQAVKSKISIVSYAPAATDLQELFLQVTDRAELPAPGAQA